MQVWSSLFFSESVGFDSKVYGNLLPISLIQSLACILIIFYWTASIRSKVILEIFKEPDEENGMPR